MRLFFTATVVVALIGNSLVFGSTKKLSPVPKSDLSSLLQKSRSSYADDNTQDSEQESQQAIPLQNSQNIPSQSPQRIPSETPQIFPSQNSQSNSPQSSDIFPTKTSQIISSESPQSTPSQSSQRNPFESVEANPDSQQTRPPVSGQNFPKTKPDNSLTGNHMPASTGEDVQIQDVPYQLGLEIEGVRLCGASIIGEHWALTSAYCTHSPPSSKKTVRFRSKTTLHRALHITTYPSTRSSNAAPHDIAVALVTPSFPKTSALSLPTKHPEAGTLAVLTGWGKQKCPQPGSCFQRQSVPVVDHAVCLAMYAGARMEVGDGMLCAGNLVKGKGACIGDPGGPLVVGTEVVGIVSWGKDCSGEFPGVYTDVAKYRDWIMEIIGNDDA